MAASILTSIKKVLGVADDYTVFDPDIIIHTNSILSVLNQLGVGPVGGFMIEDAGPTWEDFLGTDPNLNLVKTYVCLRVRMLFDPPGTSYLINAMKEQAQELEWRLNVVREGEQWTDPETNLHTTV